MSATKVTVIAAEPWNATGVSAQKGCTYRFDVPADAQWKDAFIRCGPDGFLNLLDPFGWLLRVKRVRGRKVRYFSLVGTVGQDNARAFIIEKGATYTAEWDGQIHLFANDAPFAYGNNSLSINVTITEIPNASQPRPHLSSPPAITSRNPSSASSRACSPTTPLS